jgi:hypothetical protein
VRASSRSRTAKWTTLRRSSRSSGESSALRRVSPTHSPGDHRSPDLQDVGRARPPKRPTAGTSSAAGRHLLRSVL